MQDIVPFVQEHWAAIFTNRTKTTSWHGSLNKVLVSEKLIFIMLINKELVSILLD